MLRLSGNVASGTTFSFLGLGSLNGVGGWRTDFATRPLQELGAAIAPHKDTSLRTTALPRGRRFTVAVTTKGDDVAVRAIFRSPLGDYESVPLGQTKGRRTVVLRGRIPFVHASLAQVELDLLNGGRLRTRAPACSRPRRACSRSGHRAWTAVPSRRPSRRGSARAASAAPRRGSATC